VVVGAGIFGSSVAWEAARRGRKTLLVERRAVPNPIAASYGPSRKIRSTYVEPHYANLAQEAMAAWRSLEAELGPELYLPVGNLAYTALDEQPHLDELERVSRLVGSRLQALDQAALRRRFPQFKRARRALFEEQAGFLRATACVTTLQQQALRHGAEILDGCEVESIEPGSPDLVLSTTRGRFRAPWVVAATGGWSNRLLPELSSALVQTQQALVYLDGVPAEYAHPTFVPFSCHDSGFYGFAAEPGVGLKVAQHVEGERLADPDFDRTATPPGFRAEVGAFIQEHLGLRLDDYRLTFDSCMYNLSRSNDFLLDFHPRLPGLFVATAGSGHGFKFGSILGQIVLDRLDGVSSDRWSPLFSYEHFMGALAAPRLL
jgi:glycine/D-amino acid oxidase-like deaminating enzyme